MIKAGQCLELGRKQCNRLLVLKTVHIQPTQEHTRPDPGGTVTVCAEFFTFVQDITTNSFSLDFRMDSGVESKGHTV